MGSEKKVENLSLLCGKKCLKNSLFSPREKERSFEVSLDEETILLFREFSRESFVSLFSRLAPSSLGSPPRKKKLGTLPTIRHKKLDIQDVTPVRRPTHRRRRDPTETRAVV